MNTTRLGAALLATLLTALLTVIAAARLSRDAAAHGIEMDYRVAGRSLTVELFYAPAELIEGVRVSVSATGEGVVARGTTDGAGRAEFTIPEGLDAVMLKVEHDGHKAYYEVELKDRDFAGTRGWSSSLTTIAVGVVLIVALCGLVMLALRKRGSPETRETDD